MAVRPTNSTETGLEAALFGLGSETAKSTVLNFAHILTERRALAEHTRLAVGLGLVAGAALGYFATLAGRWKEEA